MVNPDLRSPVQFLSDARRVGNIPQRHWGRQCGIFFYHWFDLYHCTHSSYDVAQADSVETAAAKIVECIGNLRFDKRAASAREIVDIKDVANRIDSRRHANRYATLYRFHVMRNHP